MDPLAIIAIVFVVIAIVLLTVTLVLISRVRRRLAGRVRVLGTIISVRGAVERRRDSDGMGTHAVHVRYPTVVYTDPGADREHTFESRVSTLLPVNATLPVAIRPGAPDTAVVSSFQALWVGPLILGIMTAGFSAAAVGLALGAAFA